MGLICGELRRFGWFSERQVRKKWSVSARKCNTFGCIRRKVLKFGVKKETADENRNLSD